MCGLENDVFPCKFKYCIVSTTIKPEQPGQSLRKPQEKIAMPSGRVLNSEIYLLTNFHWHNFTEEFVQTKSFVNKTSIHLYSTF